MCFLILSTAPTDLQCIAKAPLKGNLLPNQVELSRERAIQVPDVLKFGPMLQNVLMASSITRAVQLLGATLSFHQLQLFFTSQADSLLPKDAFTHCTVSTTQHSTVFEAPVLTCEVARKHDKAQNVVRLEKTTEVQQIGVKPSVALQPAPTPQVNILKSSSSPPLPNNYQHSGDCSSNSTPVPSLLIGQGMENNVFLLHQKQTSSQLVHFLRSNAKNKHVMEVTYEWSEYFQYTSGLCQTEAAATAPLVDGVMKHQTREAEMEEPGVAASQVLLRKQSFPEVDTHYPVFTVKRVESGGSLTYTCMIATKTELWDVGDIFTDVRHTTSQSSAFEKEGNLQISCTEDHVERTTNAILPPSQLQTEEANPRLEVSRDLEIFQKCSVSSSVNLFRGPELKHLSIPKCSQTSIPKFQVRKYEEMAVVVSHMVSPGCFYIQHSDASLQLQALHAE